MKISLGVRLLMIFVLINALGVAIEVGVLGKVQRESSLAAARDQGRALGESMRSIISTEGGLNVRAFLTWPSWGRFQDAILVNGIVRRAPDGEVRIDGTVLNPLGGGHRTPGFPLQDVYRGVDIVLREQKVVEGVAGGSVIPVHSSEGPWGALWFKRTPPETLGRVFRSVFLPAFLLTTLFLTGAAYVAMRRLVLRPVEELAEGAQRVADGEFDVHLEPPARNDELTDLMRSFNSMTAEVRGFNQRLEHEVQQATRAARDAEAAAMTQRRLAATGELAAGIAHEINNPLGGLMNAVDVLGRDELDPKKRAQYLELLSTGLERIRRTVGQVLRFTPRSTEVQGVSVARCVEDALGLVRHRARSQGVELDLSCGGSGGEEDRVLGAMSELPEVRGQGDELAQAVLNLLVNALDALESREPGSSHGPRIRLDLSRCDAELRLEVQDNGPGVEEDVLGRARDLFFTTKDAGKGTGLGLSIVHNVADEHGGRLELWSRPGEGFRATLCLPIGSPGAEGAPRGIPSGAAAPDDEAPGGSPSTADSSPGLPPGPSSGSSSGPSSGPPLGPPSGLPPGQGDPS